MMMESIFCVRKEHCGSAREEDLLLAREEDRLLVQEEDVLPARGDPRLPRQLNGDCGGPTSHIFFWRLRGKSFNVPAPYIYIYI